MHYLIQYTAFSLPSTIRARLPAAVGLVALTGSVAWAPAHPFYLTNDDVAMRLLVEGHFAPHATPTAFVMFMHVSIGWLLKSLYTVIASVPWYDLLMTVASVTAGVAPGNHLDRFLEQAPLAESARLEPALSPSAVRHAAVLTGGNDDGCRRPRGDDAGRCDTLGCHHEPWPGCRVMSVRVWHAGALGRSGPPARSGDSQRHRPPSDASSKVLTANTPFARSRGAGGDAAGAGSADPDRRLPTRARLAGVPRNTTTRAEC